MPVQIIELGQIFKFTADKNSLLTILPGSNQIFIYKDFRSPITLEISKMYESYGGNDMYGVVRSTDDSYGGKPLIGISLCCSGNDSLDSFNLAKRVAELIKSDSLKDKRELENSKEIKVFLEEFVDMFTLCDNEESKPSEPIVPSSKFDILLKGDQLIICTENNNVLPVILREMEPTLDTPIIREKNKHIVLDPVRLLLKDRTKNKFYCICIDKNDERAIVFLPRPQGKVEKKIIYGDIILSFADPEWYTNYDWRKQGYFLTITKDTFNEFFVFEDFVKATIFSSVEIAESKIPKIIADTRKTQKKTTYTTKYKEDVESIHYERQGGIWNVKVKTEKNEYVFQIPTILKKAKQVFEEHLKSKLKDLEIYCDSKKIKGDYKK